MVELAERAVVHHVRLVERRRLALEQIFGVHATVAISRVRATEDACVDAGRRRRSSACRIRNGAVTGKSTAPVARARGERGAARGPGDAP